MNKLSRQEKERLNNYTDADEFIPIICLPQGFSSGGISMEPCIFIGPKNKILLLWKNEITVIILTKILNKAIKDSNKAAIINLLRFTIYNKKKFWQRYKNTKLGTNVMADILGKHE